MPHRIRCVKCHRTGWVRAETIVRGTISFVVLYCGFCDFAWKRGPDGKDHPINMEDDHSGAD